MGSLTSGLAQPDRQSRRPRPSARTLSVGALALWISSLALTGIVLYAEQRRLTGAEILALGWLSPLVGNFAWFANPLFLWAFLRLQIGKAATRPTLLSLLLALDALRYSDHLLNEGGSTTAVYGYGWGLVLWLAALFVMAAAAGTRQIEIRLEANGAARTDERLRPIAFALCISILLAAVYLAIHDHKRANRVERERLTGLAFKRGPVCAADDPLVAQPLILGLGPLEVELSKHDTGLYPFNKPTALLKWGIPVVRVAGRDYSYAPSGDGQILTSVPASGAAKAVLVVAASVVNGRRQIAAKLVEQATQRTVFEQVWRVEAESTRYCPHYSSFPKQGDQPRKLLTEALAVQSPPADARRQADHLGLRADNRVPAALLSKTDAPRSAEQTSQPSAKSAASPGHGEGSRRLWMGNRNCPANVGWDGSGSRGSPVFLDTGWAFMVGDRAFYPGRRDRYNVLCAGDHAYLFFGAANDGKYYLTLEKRRLSDFHQAWSGTVVIQDQDLATGADVLKVDTVDEDADGLTIALAMEQASTRAVIKAPLRLSR